MKRPIPELDSSRYALFRITEGAQRKLEKLVFHRHPEREWGTFFRFGYRQAPWGVALSFVELIPPQPGDLDRNSPIVSFRPDYIARALDGMERQPFGVGVVHSHPQGWGGSPSPSDDDMDAYYLRLFEPYGNGRPYVSLIVNRDEDGQFVFSGRAFDRGVWMPVTGWFVPGDVLKRYRSLLQRKPEAAPETATGESVIARWELLVGSQVRDRFAGASIGIIGCSGTGSPAIEALARAQVGEFVLVDEQRIGLSNIERMHGSRLADLQAETPPFKVEIMARLIREVNSRANITMLVGNVLDDTVLDALLRCDLVLGCTDTLHARARLGDLASLYLLPSLDVGVLPRGQNGKVVSQHIDFMRLGPDDPCPYCRGRIHPVVLNAELMAEHDREKCREAAAEAVRRGDDGAAYWGGDAPQLPTVGYLTTTAGALAAGYALNWLLGTSEMPHARFQIDIGAAEFAFATDNVRRRSHCSCGRQIGHADQGERSITMPEHFPKAVQLIRDRVR